jgi:hypothetical protein
MNLDNYELIDFYLWRGKEKVRKYRHGRKSYVIRGARIGEHLVVARSNPSTEMYKVYVLNSHKPFVNVSFATITDAITFAERLKNLLADYLLLLEEYPGSDVIALSKWSIPFGVRLYEMIQILKGQKGIDIEDVDEAYLEAQENAKQWTSQLGRPA